MTVKAAALKLRQMLSVVNPSTNEVAFYPKADNKWYKKDSTGWETLVDNPGTMLAPVKACSWNNPGNITLSGPQTVDGVSCVAGDRVLLKWQTSTPTNGIYVVQTGTWTRATDADTAAKIARGTQVLALGGTNQPGKLFVQTETVTTIGTDNQNWDGFLSVDLGGSLQYPTPFNAGHLYFDQNQKCIAAYDGVAWQRLRGPILCTSATRPGFVTDNAFIYETDTGLPYVYSAGAWVRLIPSVLPVTELRTTKIDYNPAGSGDIALGVSINAAGNYIYGLHDPTNTDHAMTKGFADAHYDPSTEQPAEQVVVFHLEPS